MLNYSKYIYKTLSALCDCYHGNNNIYSTNSNKGTRYTHAILALV